VELYEGLCEDERKYVLAKKLLRSGTNIGANVTEAVQGRSKKVFLHKMNIALKECAQTEYWIRLFAATEYLGQSESEAVLADCVELEKIVACEIRIRRDAPDGQRRVEQN
jgi:four helix bundle protein